MMRAQAENNNITNYYGMNCTGFWFTEMITLKLEEVVA